MICLPVLLQNRDCADKRSRYRTAFRAEGAEGCQDQAGGCKQLNGSTVVAAELDLPEKGCSEETYGTDKNIGERQNGFIDEAENK